MSNPLQNRITDLIPLVDLINDAVIVRDPAGRIHFWNRGAERLYGWSKEEAVGKNSHELLRTSFPYSLEKIQRDLKEVSHWKGELCQIARDLNAVIVSSRWHLCIEHDSQSDVWEVSTDVTAQRNIEEDLRHLKLELARERHSAEETLQTVRESMAAKLEQAEATRTLRMGRFRHDLIDHLGSIIGFLQLLEDGRHGELDPRQKHCVNNIGVSVNGIRKVVERISDSDIGKDHSTNVCNKSADEPVPEHDVLKERLIHD